MKRFNLGVVRYLSSASLTIKKWMIIQRFKSIPVYLIMIILPAFLYSCQEEEDVIIKEPWEKEIDQLKSAVLPYFNIDEAIADGYDLEFTGYRSQMGYHYLKASLLDDLFELKKPEVLMYAPDDDGNLQFVGVEYAVPIADMDNPPPAPEGFTGNADEWEINTEFNVWTLHVWVGLDNPKGIFKPHNPKLP